MWRIFNAVDFLAIDNVNNGRGGGGGGETGEELHCRRDVDECVAQFRIVTMRRGEHVACSAHAAHICSILTPNSRHDNYIGFIT